MVDGINRLVCQYSYNSMFNNLEDTVNTKVREPKEILEKKIQYLKWKSYWMKLISN